MMERGFRGSYQPVSKIIIYLNSVFSREIIRFIYSIAIIAISGTLAPPLLPETHPDYNSSIDVIFATYWFYPAETVVLLPEDQACVDEKKKNEKQRFDPKSKTT